MLCNVGFTSHPRRTTSTFKEVLEQGHDAAFLRKQMREFWNFGKESGYIVLI